MRILDNEWRDGFLDYALTAGSCRIRVDAWHTLAELKDLYFSPARDWRVVFNYWREFGARQVVRKVHSRRSERSRNRKYVGGGFGEVMEVKGSSSLRVGDAVVFLAPSHPRCVQRVCLPFAFVAKSATPFSASDAIAYLPQERSSRDWLHWAGWSEYSGSTVDPHQLRSALAGLEAHLAGLNWASAESLPAPASAIAETSNRVLPRKQISAVLFGYGHYAKTNILPNLASQISVAKVHEIDPTQLGQVDQHAFTCDSSPAFREDERFDLAFIAGYHHTHAPLAAQTLDRGGIAVVEKPIATDTSQLQALLTSLRVRPGCLFAGFHKRYSPLNALALEDMAAQAGDPVSYHCIVHEVPLPSLHWYKWPNSCSRLVSNGCHWIDHFLFLNHFSEPIRYSAQESASGEVAVFIELMNGASFTMALTDHGSSRIGVEDYIELRRGDVTVRITNGSVYRAENSRKRLRATKVNRTASYADMYRQISDRIARGLPGDTVDSVERSTSLVLALEACLSDSRVTSTERSPSRIMAGIE